MEKIHENTYMYVFVASSPALSPAFIACSMKSAYLHEFEKSWGRPGNEAMFLCFHVKF